MNADNILFRASSIGYIMTEPREKTLKERGELAETVKTHLVDKFVSAKYGRETDIQNKYIAKGLQVEEDSITLYSRVKKEVFRKNELNISNEYISGTPDLFTGEDIIHADMVIDIKSSWDIFTFFRTTRDKLNKMYYWQLQAYMALTGAKSSRLVYCLVNTPEALIYDEIRKLQWKMGVLNPETDELFQKAQEETEKLLRYDDIPIQERYNEIIIERNEEDIQRIYERVKVCRQYMNTHLFKSEPKILVVS